MITRMWVAHATREGASRYQEHFASHVLPALSGLDGYLGASLIGRNHGDEVELVVLTRWRSIESVRAFAGEDLERAVVADEAQAVLARWDPRVRHYEVRLGSEGPPSPPAPAPAMTELPQALFELSPLVRYVALLRGRDLQLRERPGLAGASASETDRYEELLVNPAVLTLLRRRGEIDCGGLDHLWIRYGNFWTGLFPIADGHLNVGLEPSAVPTDFVERIRAEVRRRELT